MNTLGLVLGGVRLSGWSRRYVNANLAGCQMKPRMNADKRRSAFICVYPRLNFLVAHRVTANDHDVLDRIWIDALGGVEPRVERERAGCVVVEVFRAADQIIPRFEAQRVTTWWHRRRGTRRQGDLDRRGFVIAGKLRLHFHKQLHPTDRNRLALEKKRETFLRHRHRQTLSRAQRRVQEASPLSRELVTQAEHLRQTTLAFYTNEVVKRGL